MSLLGEEQGIAYFKRLSQQDLRLVEGYTHTVNLMAAGEYSLTGFMQISKLDAMKRKQAPVDWIAGPQTLATISTVAMIKNPLHPAAAQLLIDFYLSAEGQRGLAAAGKIPLRRGVKSQSREGRSVDGVRQFSRDPARRRLRSLHEDYNEYLAVR